MGKIIAIANQKGGVGKSTTALALSEILGSRGKRVLLIDLDAQCNSTYASGAVPGTKTVTDVLSGEKPEEAIVKVKYYDLLPGDEFLTNVERTEDVNLSLIRNSIKPLTKDYDYLILDTPPALGNLLVGALVAADYLIIPMEATPFALQGLTALFNTVQAVQKGRNKTLKVLGIVLVKYTQRPVLNRNIADTLKDYAVRMGTTVFDANIRSGIAVAEAQIEQVPLIDYAPKSNPCKDYLALVDEILVKIKEEIR